MSDYELAIAYRIYPGLDNEHYKSDELGKYEISKICLQSFVNSLTGIDYKLYAIIDDCPQKYVTLFRDLIPNDRLDIYRLSGIGNNKTFLKQMQILLEQNISEAVYFAEDDYIYIDNEFRDMLSVLERENVDFVTPYDHPDYYQTETIEDKPSYLSDLHNYTSDIIYENRHWRSVSSTTCTFLTSKQTLEETKSYFKLYPKISDYGMWICLTKKRKKHYMPTKTVQMYIHSGKDILLDKCYNLWSPLPSIATHMEKQYLAKGINWDKILRNYR